MSSFINLDILSNASIRQKDGSTVSRETLATNDLVGFYFSAHWCPPCRAFTPVLAEFYTQLQAADKRVEVIFISADRDQTNFDNYYASQPWLALDFSDSSMKSRLETELDIDGYPTLVWIDPKTGVCNKEGRATVRAGIDYFPFNSEAMARYEVEREAKEAKAKADAQSAIQTVFDDWKIFDGKFDTADLRSAEAVVIIFGHASSNARYVVPELKTTHERLSTRLAVVFVPLASTDADSAQQAALPSSWKKVSADDGKALVAKLPSFADDGLCTYVLSGDSKTCHNTDASRVIYQINEKGFPWSEAALAAEAKRAREAEEKADREAKEFKEAHFGSPGLSFLANANIIGKDGKSLENAAQTLLDNDFVGLYFSAHWCGPCRAFTPKFARVYNELKAAGKKIEVIFVSSDQDQSSFDEYYVEMPWLALSYTDRQLKSQLSGALDVSGIPSLTLINPRSGELVMNGRGAIDAGPDYWPWGVDDMARFETDRVELERKAKEAALARAAVVEQGFRDANTVVVKNHRGMGTVHPDYKLDFQNFNTFVGDIKLSGGKFYYEVEVNNPRSVAQMGWSTAGFKSSESSRGEGVGDNNYSWGFDGQRVQKWGNGSATDFGIEWKTGDVLGFAVDFEKKNISFSVNGSFEGPLGEAFTNVAAEWVQPALTSSGGTYTVNFGDRPFSHTAPDDSYLSVHSAL
jgi:nucleoredoxin